MTRTVASAVVSRAALPGGKPQRAVFTETMALYVILPENSRGKPSPGCGSRYWGSQSTALGSWAQNLLLLGGVTHPEHLSVPRSGDPREGRTWSETLVSGHLQQHGWTWRAFC